MSLPEFILYGENEKSIESDIQPELSLRKWADLSNQEKQTAFQELKNKHWVDSYSQEILSTIEYLNHQYLRQCPGKHLHGIKPKSNHGHMRYNNDSDRMKAAILDFEHIFMQEESEVLVFRMLSKFAEGHIDGFAYRQASEAKEKAKQREYIDEAFRQFDKLANCLNHIFEQFAVNQVVTRNGFIPRQEDKIQEDVYVPTLHLLSNPKWKTVSTDLAEMFEDYRQEDYAETITRAHRAIQRFLQVLVGEEGKNGKGEVGKLLKQIRDEEIIPLNRFTEPLINLTQSFITSERANNSTAKPSTKEANATDALLMMNIVIVFLQYCLQNQKNS